jgi:hypothetical protein
MKDEQGAASGRLLAEGNWLCIFLLLPTAAVTSPARGAAGEPFNRIRYEAMGRVAFQDPAGPAANINRGADDRASDALFE